ncbi:MAG: CopG family ribbon-helix-helix protein [Candidatus Rokuibacteriota bacterium]
MGSAKVAITIERDLLAQVDRWVADGRYPNRSRAIQAAVREKLERSRKRRLAEEAAKLDLDEERALAEEGLASEAAAWPAY